MSGESGGGHGVLSLVRITMLAALMLALVAIASDLFCGPPNKAASNKDLQVVEIGLGPKVEIRPLLAKGGAGNHESFAEIVGRNRPYAAINGTFYDSQYRPLGDVLRQGKLVVRGRYPNAIAMRNNGKVEFVRRKGDNFDWRGYRFALAAGPRLIHSGKLSLTPIADGFSERALVIRATRSAVGLSKSGKLLLVVCQSPVTLTEFAVALRDIGAVEAMNLDGGPACGLYHNGKIIIDATLPMTNVLAVYKK
jgi:uncharacterized protein YigE (DUF2233 family)